MSRKTATIAEIDELLRQIDDEMIAEGKPILSVIVLHDDGTVGNAFWASVLKHKLRLPDESDQQMINRLRKLAFDYHGKAKII